MSAFSGRLAHCGMLCQPNKCFCHHGRPAINSELCYDNHVESCISCDANNNFYLSERTSDNGTVYNVCEIKCPAGFHRLNENSNACQANECFCSGGVRLDQCLEHKTESCSTCHENNRFMPVLTNVTHSETNQIYAKTICRLQCDFGFHPSIDGNTCQPNRCSCYGGSILERCHQHQAVSCSSCNVGYEPIQNNVVLDSGLQYEFTTCQLKCEIGSRPETLDPVLNQQVCVVNQCVCPGGNKQELCEFDGAHVCQSCAHGFSEVFTTTEPGLEEISVRQCHKNNCICVNGLARGLCPADEHFCIDCNPGYHKGDSSTVLYNADQEPQRDANGDLIFENPNHCYPNICLCPNGVPFETMDEFMFCEHHMNVYCLGCYTGYHAQDDYKQCIENVCMCPHGVPEGKKINGVQTYCNVDGQIECGACHQGFHLSFIPSESGEITRDTEKECVRNVCRCDHGTPQVETNCRYHYDPTDEIYSDAPEQCLKCDEGFHRVDNSDHVASSSCVKKKIWVMIDGVLVDKNDLEESKEY